jgi:hypothetical protein
MAWWMPLFLPCGGQQFESLLVLTLLVHHLLCHAPCGIHQNHCLSANPFWKAVLLGFCLKSNVFLLIHSLQNKRHAEYFAYSRTKVTICLSISSFEYIIWLKHDASSYTLWMRECRDSILRDTCCTRLQVCVKHKYCWVRVASCQDTAPNALC